MLANHIHRALSRCDVRDIFNLCSESPLKAQIGDLVRNSTWSALEAKYLAFELYCTELQDQAETMGKFVTRPEDNSSVGVFLLRGDRLFLVYSHVAFLELLNLEGFYVPWGSGASLLTELLELVQPTNLQTQADIFWIPLDLGCSSGSQLHVLAHDAIAEVMGRIAPLVRIGQLGTKFQSVPADDLELVSDLAQC